MTANSTFDYLTESARTASGHFHGHLVALPEMQSAMQAFISAAQSLDRIKKLLFYGEDAKKGRLSVTHTIDHLGKLNANAAINAMPTYTDVSKHLLHGILGSATEAGEMVEMLFATIFEGKELDLVNLSEEIGDAQWYEAMLARVMGKTFDQIQRRNIEKLRLRYPDKFSTNAANNRDTDAERAVLEGGEA